MKTFTKALAVVLFSLPLLANAAGKSASASMQVTFEVKESCTVQTPDNATAAANTNSNTKTAPTVACQLKSPYLTARSTNQAATSSDKAANTVRQETAGEWTIYF
ncbi:hypothetical protein SAMN05192549_108151 [Duganella sacchari]|uniref:Uncharacterized protein n=1 Tax=Duganella sacchari TaxID=551987 RepID=A0A1M7QX23_9BURK|nr:hypothetical protein [Duganella sacchari]SHN36257.1 hypothetical protein SAMN05192549_108151 [Duganella sacchari]